MYLGAGTYGSPFGSYDCPFSPTQYDEFGNEIHYEFWTVTSVDEDERKEAEDILDTARKHPEACKYVEAYEAEMDWNTSRADRRRAIALLSDLDLEIGDAYADDQIYAESNNLEEEFYDFIACRLAEVLYNRFDLDEEIA